MADDSWDAQAALLRCGVAPWSGMAFRAHGPSRSPLSMGSGQSSGRYHRGLDQYLPGEAFQAFYLGLNQGVCLAETLRHINPGNRDDVVRGLRRRITRFSVSLERVVDCRHLATLGLTHDEMCGPSYDHTHRLAIAARTLGVQALVVPSATRLGDNLVVFIDPAAVPTLVVLDYVDPPLFAGDT